MPLREAGGDKRGKEIGNGQGKMKKGEWKRKGREGLMVTKDGRKEERKE